MKLSLLLFIFLSSSAFARLKTFNPKPSIINCSPGLVFSIQDRTLSIVMDGNPYEDQLQGYLKKGNYSYIKTGLVWSHTLNSFYVSDQYSTVHLYQYKDERAARLVAHRAGFPTLSIKFNDCVETSR